MFDRVKYKKKKLDLPGLISRFDSCCLLFDMLAGLPLGIAVDVRIQFDFFATTFWPVSPSFILRFLSYLPACRECWQKVFIYCAWHAVLITISVTYAVLIHVTVFSVDEIHCLAIKCYAFILKDQLLSWPSLFL